MKYYTLEDIRESKYEDLEMEHIYFTGGVDGFIIGVALTLALSFLFVLT